MVSKRISDDANVDSQDAQERYPLLTAEGHEPSPEEDVIVLSDGRKMGIAYYGAAQSGSPTVFYLHGFPGSRLSGSFFDGPGEKLGARIIAVDRPGIGNSSPQPGRTALDHARDIGEVAAQLGVPSYGVIGVSGGGLYALACAYSLPEENLKGVSILAGMGPIDVGTKGMNWSNWFIFKGFMLAAVLAKTPNGKIVPLVTSQLSKPSSSRYMSATDRAILQEDGFLDKMIDFYREHYKQGVDGHMEDGRVLTSDLRFRLQDIRSDLPVQLWYSKDDTNVPLRMGEAIASRLSSPPQLHVINDETHLSLIIKYSANVLEHLLEKM